MSRTRSPSRSARASIAADLYRIDGRTGTRALLQALWRERPFAAIVTLRLVQSFSDARFLRRVLGLLHRLAANRAGMDISPDVEVGPGLRIIHGRNVVVNDRARIGANVTLFHGVTIGQRDRWEAGRIVERHSVVGDGVFLGPYAQVLGATIGEDSVVAPLSAVIHDVPPKTVVCGVPAKPVDAEPMRWGRHFWPGVPTPCDVPSTDLTDFASRPTGHSRG